MPWGIERRRRASLWYLIEISGELDSQWGVNNPYAIGHGAAGARDGQKPGGIADIDRAWCSWLIAHGDVPRSGRWLVAG
jgi:hypothetical protein